MTETSLSDFRERLLICPIRAVRIEIGISDSRYTEVASGELKAGDAVAVEELAGQKAGGSQQPFRFRSERGRSRTGREVDGNVVIGLSRKTADLSYPLEDALHGPRTMGQRLVRFLWRELGYVGMAITKTLLILAFNFAAVFVFGWLLLLLLKLL